MLSPGTPTSPMTLRVRSLFANAWVLNWQSSASHLLLVAMQENRLTVHSATNGEWLAGVDWCGPGLLVDEAQNDESPYQFSGHKEAFTFLDAVLMSYVAKATDQQSSPILRVAGAQ
jgi:hypothetical protein